MAKIWEYAALSDDVYNPNEIEDIKRGYYLPHLPCIRPSWLGLPSLSSGQQLQPPPMQYGFFARLYENQLTKETIISFRGTLTNNQYNLWDDFNIGIKSWDNACTQAIKFYSWALSYLRRQSHLQYPPKLTGHSLGGYLAQVVLAEFPSTQAVIFNAPKLDNIFLPKYNKSTNYSSTASAQVLSYLPGSFIKILKRSKYQKLFNNFIYVSIKDPLFQEKLINIDIDQDIIHHIGKAQGMSYILYSNEPINCPNSLIFFPFIGNYAYKKYTYHSIDKTLDILEKNKMIANEKF